MKFRKGILTGIAALAAASMTLSVSAAGLGYSSQDVEFYIDNTEDVYLSAKINFPDTVMTDLGGITIDAKLPADCLDEGAYIFKAESIVDEDLRTRTQKALSALYDDEYHLASLKEIYAFDLSFTDENSNFVSPEGVGITLNMFYEGGCSYDIFVEEADGTLVKVDREFVMTGMFFIAPHFSRFVAAGYYDQYIGPVPSPIPDEDASVPEEGWPDNDPTTPDPTTADPTSSKPTSPRPTDKTSHVPSQNSESSVDSEISDLTSDTTGETSDTSAPLPKPDDKGANTGDSGSAVAVAAGIVALAALGAAVIASKSKKTSK